MKKFLLSVAIGAAALGANAQKVYFTEDFEWLAPWCAVGDGTNFPAADIVGCNQESTVQPQITKSAVDGVTAEQALLDRGYSLMRYDKNGPNAKECIYIQSNYLKLGKTGFQGELILPAMEELGEGVERTVLSFDWYPQRQGSFDARETGVFDPTELVVIVANGTTETQFPVPAHPLQTGDDARWIRAEISLEGALLNKESRIHIRNIDSQLKSTKALRWHIDNITLAEANNSTDAIAEVETSLSAPKQYFNLQGCPVANPTSGVYIVRQGSNVSKVVL